MFDQHCATCHASDKTGRRMPLAGIDTDRGRMGTWNKDNAIAANKVVTEMGIIRKGLVEAPSTATTLRSSTACGCARPYLHHGAVPTLRDLLNRRPTVRRFSGAATTCTTSRTSALSRTVPDAERVGTKFDTSALANGNGGHVFGTTLPAAEKESLIEYLKTL